MRNSQCEETKALEAIRAGATKTGNKQRALCRSLLNRSSMALARGSECQSGLRTRHCLAILRFSPPFPGQHQLLASLILGVFLLRGTDGQILYHLVISQPLLMRLICSNWHDSWVLSNGESARRSAQGEGVSWSACPRFHVHVQHVQQTGY